ncbi:MAG: L,D-transpeptidase/peptidoglycan binding protein, partial [Actinomycetota bacterium]|nr:L,D-transpeptidase/peptidoglycan binding protein [Actinomycetota bacterium]
RGRRFKLTASRARVRTDVDGIVQDAVARSRRGNFLTRSFRDLSGVDTGANLPARVTYSQRAVDALVRHVQHEVDRPAQDARVDFVPTRLKKVPSKRGYAVRTGDLANAVKAELVRPNADRVVRVQTRVLQPKVTAAELAGKYPLVLTISRSERQLRVFRRLKHKQTYTIAVGRAGFESPPGLFKISNKAVDPAWSVPEWGGELAGQVIPGGAANNPLKARWLGVADGVGIHGTDDVASLGTAASHGCFRMSIPEVKRLYSMVPVGTPIYIG